MEKYKSSFSWTIKKEIINNITKTKEIKSFLYGLYFSNAIEKEDFQIITIKNNYILNKVVSRLNKLKITIYKILKNKIYISNQEYKKIIDKKWEEKLTSFFAGVFCGGGSISDKNSTSYHLEISTHSNENTEMIIKKLNKYDFNFQILKRRNRYLAYTKKIDELLDFLSAIGAKKSWFELQNLKITRDIENVSNRINNIDISNLQKIANSSIKHIENINYIFENNLMDMFNDDQLVFFRIKLENSWISMNEIVKKLEQEHNIVITKSGLNHWLRKLNNIVLDHKK
ncbi:DNA-binding protein WhiA [Mycoplasma sp. CSL7503-lung]|uniref:DNA-binding protein WhiA n=1 Tax=Mycoplasma sp. CSL7503-lung TaxID=536372 RepID=UPI0021D05AD4|nr:DNA-binding protein WhiA [Mycoplasma sp. CSL7503-lung]MCU4706945.1 DNA-binding protein WhiA [Mycoplasma sp. CSL7503-lung]